MGRPKVLIELSLLRAHVVISAAPSAGPRALRARIRSCRVAHQLPSLRNPTGAGDEDHCSRCPSILCPDGNPGERNAPGCRHGRSRTQPPAGGLPKAPKTRHPHDETDAKPKAAATPRPGPHPPALPLSFLCTTQTTWERTRGDRRVGPPSSWARRRPENGHGHKRLLIPGLNAAAPCAVPPPHQIAAAPALQLPRHAHSQISLDRLTVRPVEVGRVVGRGKEADVLRDRRDDAAANLERGRAERGRQHDGAERRPVGGPEIPPQVGLQVGPEGRLADDVGAQQAGADPAAERVVGIEADRREQVPGRDRSRRSAR